MGTQKRTSDASQPSPAFLVSSAYSEGPCTKYCCQGPCCLWAFSESLGNGARWGNSRTEAVFLNFASQSGQWLSSFPGCRTAFSVKSFLTVISCSAHVLLYLFKDCSLVCFAGWQREKFSSVGWRACVRLCMDTYGLDQQVLTQHRPPNWKIIEFITC